MAGVDVILAIYRSCVRMILRLEGGLYMDGWLGKHMHGVLIAVEILWVSGFLAIFVLYFIVKNRMKRKKSQQKMDDPVNRS